MSHEIHVFENGSATLRDLSNGQLMHSAIGALAEARQIYIEQSELTARIALPRPEPLVVYDLGLGMATNALAALEAWNAAERCGRGLRLLSFETDLGGLRTALRLEALSPGCLPLLGAWRLALETLLRDRRWVSPEGQIEWTLHEGDFISQLEARTDWPRAELVFYDLYAPAVAGALWGVRAFFAVRRLAPELLLTYSTATSVRAAMIVAGFRVGHGVATAAKLETTVAATPPHPLKHPLGVEWLEKWGRSSRAFPAEMGGLTQAEFRRRLRV